MPSKILTVDDSETIRRVVQRAFRAFDCAFCEAANGAEGLFAAARERPDLIILDISMPVMDGVAMLSTLRQDPQLQGTPVLMLSAQSSQETRSSVSQLGISDFLVKPFKEEVLVEKVRKILPLAFKSA